MNIKREILSLDRDIVKAIKAVSRCARKSKVRCFLVGGFVRDVLLKIKNLDLDIAVASDGVQFAQLLEKPLKAEVVSHKRFGTAVVTFDGIKIDITTLRKEQYPYPGSLPVVSPGNLSEDLARRDFTINAMAVSINQDNFGFVFDYFSSFDDLKAKQLCVLHKDSFFDDPTRILRLARFKTRFGFSVESNTLRYITQAKKKKSLEKMQRHRIRDELMLIFKEPRPEAVIECLQQLYGVQFIHPALEFNPEKYKQFIAVRECIDWFKHRFTYRRQLDAWIMYFILLLSPLSITQLKRLATSLGLSKGEEKRLLSFKVSYHDVFNRLNNASLSPSQIYNILNPLSYEVILLCYSTVQNKLVRKYIKVFLTRYNLMRLKITGDDLKRLGVQPGPQFKQLLDKVTEAKLNSSLKTKQQELSFLRKLLHK
jgi:tRNA nucleotidyltransferase (CCA-adding enzyme)